MPPAHSERASATGGSRAEHLANNFSGALLMPAAAIKRHGPWSGLDESALVARLKRLPPGLRDAAPEPRGG